MAKEYEGRIKNITKNSWVSEENKGHVKHSKDEKKAIIFSDQADAESLLEMLNDEKADCYSLLDNTKAASKKTDFSMQHAAMKARKPTGGMKL